MTAPEVLRRAATLIRERARAATPGPWTADNEYRPLAGCRCLSCYEDEPYGKAIHDIDTVGEEISPILKPGDADHIASWHPAVALAVADVLDEVADRAELHIGVWTQPGDGFEPPALAWNKPDVLDELVEGHYGRALAVARTYLGDAA